MNETERMNYLESCLLPDEEILWQAEPVKHIYFKEEKKYMNSAIIALSVGLIPLIGVFVISHNVIFVLAFLIITLPFEIKMWSRLSEWKKRKESTVFVITNKRVLDVFRQDNTYRVNDRFLSEIEYYETRCFEQSCNIHLGKYRLDFGTPFNYARQAVEKKRYSYNYSINNTFVTFMNDVNYLCFFDLEDVTKPVELIKEYTNATEYVDIDQ